MPREVPEFRQVYFIESPLMGLVKIGVANDARARLRELQVGSADKLVLRGVFEVDDAYAYEQKLHVVYAAQRKLGEWFKPNKDLRELMDAAFEPGARIPQLCLKPRETTGTVIRWQDGDTVETFTRRVAIVGHALFPDIYDPPDAIVPQVKRVRSARLTPTPLPLEAEK